MGPQHTDSWATSSRAADSATGARVAKWLRGRIASSNPAVVSRPQSSKEVQRDSSSPWQGLSLPHAELQTDIKKID